MKIVLLPLKPDYHSLSILPHGKYRTLHDPGGQR